MDEVAFDDIRAELRAIWHNSHWDQDAWELACKKLWLLLENHPDRYFIEEPQIRPQ